MRVLTGDVVNHAKQILIGHGLGSGGGPLVRCLHLMGISDGAPIQFCLLFERFINPNRIDLANADFAFMLARRHEVIESSLRAPGGSRMPFNDVVDPEQLAVLAAVLNDICLAAGIEPQSPESEDAAGLLMHLHRVGCRTADELKTTFEEVRRQA